MWNSRKRYEAGDVIWGATNVSMVFEDGEVKEPCYNELEERRDPRIRSLALQQRGL